MFKRIVMKGSRKGGSPQRCRLRGVRPEGGRLNPPVKVSNVFLSGFLSAALAAFPSGAMAFAEAPATSPGEHSGSRTQIAPDSSFAGNDDIVLPLSYSENPVSPAVDRSAFADDEWVTAGGLQIAGGVEGSDWVCDADILHIKSSTPMAIRNADASAATSTTIQIDAGVKADLTLAGVNILNNSRTPLNLITNIYDIDPSGNGNSSPATNGDAIVNKTMLYLTLADGSVNYLKNNANANGRPGIRCGWGSVLVVDDSVANIKAGGSKFNLDDIVTPEGGAVPYDAQLIDGTVIHESDPLNVMETDGVPGKLMAQGGRDNASIGSESRENAGTMVFNGGDVEALGCVAADHSAGIGSGCGGSGTKMVFNGGSIKAKAASCGAAIGCGAGLTTDYCGSFASSTDAISIPVGIENSNSYSYIGTASAGNMRGTCYINVAGDITINGGDIYAEGGGHGNAVGQSGECGVATNRDHVIRVTGGTLATYTPPNSLSFPMYGIGARLGYTIVTGGSIYLRQENANSYSFEGLGDTAYNTQGIESWADVQQYPDSTLPDTDKVHAVEVNFSGEDVADNEIADWQLYVSGVPYSYGAPDHFQNGKLYLWLPNSVASKEIALELSYIDDDGAVREVDRLFGTPSVTGSTLKRYAEIVVPDGYARSLSKVYDGKPVAQYGFAEPLPTSEAGVELVDETKLTYKYQYFDKVDGTPLSEEIRVANAPEMPKDAGVIKLTLDSTEYSDDERYSTSYWGHRGTVWLEIKPVELGAASLGITLGGEALGGNGVVPAGAAGLSFGLSVDGSKLVEGDSVDGLLNGFVIECVDANGDPIDCADPKPGVYTATLNPGANGVVRDDGTVVSGGYAVKASLVTFVVAGADADVVEGVDVKVSVSNGSDSASGGSILDAEAVYGLVASDPKSGLPEAYDPSKTDVVITLDGTPVDVVDTSRSGTYDIVILNKADESDPDARDTVVHSELKVTSSRPSGGTATPGDGVGDVDNSGDGSGITFAPIDTATDVRIDPSSAGTVGGDPYFEYEAGRPVNILDMIQVRPEGADGWSDWMSGSGSGSDNPDDPASPGNPSNPTNPGDANNPGNSGSDNPDGSGNPSDPSNPGKPDDPNDPTNPDGSGSGTGPDGQAPQLPDNVKVVVTDEAGNQVDPANVTDPGTYEVTVSVKDPDSGEYIIIETLTFHVVDTSITDTDYIYKDVAKDHWGHGYIFDIGPVVINGAFNPSDVALGYMAGYAGTTDFGPSNGIIRGDAAIVIWRMAGCPDVDQARASSGADGNAAYVTGFSDCDADPTVYYNQAIAWCASKGIVTGYEGTGEYRPQNHITREEFASIIARYAAFKGTDIASAEADLSQYPDIEHVSDWAAPNMQYVVANGIMTGRGTDEGTADGTHGILDPQAHVTRAEVAKMAYMEQPMKP